MVFVYSYWLWLCPLSLLQRVAQLLRCVQDQMNLLALDTQSDFKVLLEASDAQEAPMETLKNKIQRWGGSAGVNGHCKILVYFKHTFTGKINV